MAKKEKKERVTMWIGPGRFSYPFFSEVDEGREFSDSAYKTDLFITKETFKEKGKGWQDKVKAVGAEAFGSAYKLTSDKYRSPFKDTDTDDDIENESLKNSIMVRAKAKPRKDKPAVQPLFIGPKKDSNGQPIKLTDEEIAAIKGGDWGMINVTVFSYDKGNGKGVSLGLNAVQFWKKGEALGQGRAKLLESMEELADDIDEPTDDAEVEVENDEDDDII